MYGSKCTYTGKSAIVAAAAAVVVAADATTQLLAAKQRPVQPESEIDRFRDRQRKSSTSVGQAHLIAGNPSLCALPGLLAAACPLASRHISLWFGKL